MIGIGDKMKRFGDKSFWLILVISIVTLIILVVGVIFLTRKSAKEFYSGGYIINSTATKTDKYYFDDNTVYKENVFNEYTFKDKNKKEVSSSKNNFIHYSDNSLSFMKKGVILDLDNLSTTLVPYYNITDKSIIRYNNGSYYVETSDKTLIFGNFLGRITENKYIIVGNDIRIKISGNEEAVTGDYFELLFVEDGIVKIENQNGSYQAVCDGTVIYVGDNIKIDLGDKNITYGDQNKLSLTEMTIDGDENIDITPDTGKVKQDNKGNQSSSTGTETGDNNGTENTTPGNNTNGTTDGNGTNGGTGDNAGNTTGENTGNDTKGDTPTSVIKKEVSVDLVNAKIGINDFRANIQVIDTGSFIKGDLFVTLVNTTTGEIVGEKKLENVSDLQSFYVASLAANCDYLITVTEKSNDGETKQYLQKSFRTEDLDLTITPEIITSDSLSYSLDFGNSNIKSANVTLTGEDGKKETREEVTAEDNVVSFTGLKSNTQYKIVVDSVIFNNTNYAQQYTVGLSNKTLKEKPELNDINVSTNDDSQTITFKVDKPTDKDSSITKYTYEVYEVPSPDESGESELKPVYTFYRSPDQLKLDEKKLKDQVIKIDSKNLFIQKNYVYKLVVEYYDNYKYNEVESGFSNSFQISGKPILEWEAKEIDFNTIKGIVRIKDEGCTIPLEGRECFDKVNNITIEYYPSDKPNDKKQVSNVLFDPKTLEYNLSLSGLKENTNYTFIVKGDIDFNNQEGLKENYKIGVFSVETKGLEALKMEWADEPNTATSETPITIDTKIVPTVTDSTYGEKIASINFCLYKGNLTEVESGEAELIKCVQDNENVKEKYYKKDFTLTSKTFDIKDVEDLKERSKDKKLGRYYTLVVDGVYDETGVNEFEVQNNKKVYEIPAIFRLEDEVSAPTITVEEIKNIDTKDGIYKDSCGINYVGTLGDDIIRGYVVEASFEQSKINIYFEGTNPAKTLTFYVKDSHNQERVKKEVDLSETDGNVVACFPLDYGTDYNQVDEDLRRGNTYTFSYDIAIDTGQGTVTYPTKNIPTSEKMESPKQEPTFQMYIDNSTESSITYKYKINDPDQALWKEKDDDKYYFYYKVGDSEDILKSEITKGDDLGEVTLSNLTKSSLYTINYYSASLKTASGPITKPVGEAVNVLFDGIYNAEDQDLNYNLVYHKDDNLLKVVIDDNELLNRMSVYLLTLSSGDDKYQIAVTDLSECDEKKCIIVDYTDIKDFKGKNIKVSLEGFYDTGRVGYSAPSKLRPYFESLGLVEADNNSQIGYVFQTTNTSEKGKYVYINDKGAYLSSDTPKGILGFKLNNSSNDWKLTTSNLYDVNKKQFTSYGNIIKNNAPVQLTTSGIKEVSSSANKYTFNPKVLDKIALKTDDNNFKFTSIIPKVDTTVEPLINGAVVNINLSIDPDTLKTDYVKDKDGKYKFYVDIYTKNECPDPSEECTEKYTLLKSEPADYENIEKVAVEGLKPNTTYYYGISADMNIQGARRKTSLFKNGVQGYVKYMSKFDTLDKEDIFSRLEFNYNSKISEDKTNYSVRTLNIKSYLNTNINFDIKYELYDINDKLEYESTISNQDITNQKNYYIANYNQDITGNNFVFGDNYHRLVIYAVTTDLGEKLELYNDTLKQGGIGEIKDIGELVLPTIVVEPNAVIDIVDGKNVYGISYRITISDEDKVIKDGIYNIELQSATEVDEKGNNINACKGHEDDCRATIDIKKYGVVVTKKFTNLSPNTNYKLRVYASTYRNNLSLSEDKKEQIASIDKFKFTKNELNFSLGRPKAEIANNQEVVITFIGASNLQSSLKGIHYTIKANGKEPIADGELGKTSTSSSASLLYKIDSEGNPTISIPVREGTEFAKSNQLLITYYIEDENGKIIVFEIGGDITKEIWF